MRTTDEPKAPPKILKVARNAMDGIGNHFRLQFSGAFSGVPIHLPRITMRVESGTHLEWFLPHVSEAVHRPQTHIRLHVFDQSVQLRPKRFSRTMLLDLAERHGQDPREPIHVMVELLPPPPGWVPLYCLCDFGGCCRLCHVPTPLICVEDAAIVMDVGVVIVGTNVVRIA